MHTIVTNFKVCVENMNLGHHASAGHTCFSTICVLTLSVNTFPSLCHSWFPKSNYCSRLTSLTKAYGLHAISPGKAFLTYFLRHQQSLPPSPGPCSCCTFSVHPYHGPQQLHKDHCPSIYKLY